MCYCSASASVKVLMYCLKIAYMSKLRTVDDKLQVDKQHSPIMGGLFSSDAKLVKQINRRCKCGIYIAGYGHAFEWLAAAGVDNNCG